MVYIVTLSDRASRFTPDRPLPLGLLRAATEGCPYRARVMARRLPRYASGTWSAKGTTTKEAGCELCAGGGIVFGCPRVSSLAPNGSLAPASTLAVVWR